MDLKWLRNAFSFSHSISPSLSLFLRLIIHMPLNPKMFNYNLLPIFMIKHFLLRFCTEYVPTFDLDILHTQKQLRSYFVFDPCRSWKINICAVSIIKNPLFFGMGECGEWLYKWNVFYFPLETIEIQCD